MFDFGWMELLIIGIVSLIVIGPKDLPKMFKHVGRFVGKAKTMAREFQRSMEEAADESGLREASGMINSIEELNSPKKMASKAFSKATDVTTNSQNNKKSSKEDVSISSKKRKKEKAKNTLKTNNE